MVQKTTAFFVDTSYSYLSAVGTHPYVDDSHFDVHIAVRSIDELCPKTKNKKRNGTVSVACLSPFVKHVPVVVDLILLYSGLMAHSLFALHLFDGSSAKFAENRRAKRGLNPTCDQTPGHVLHAVHFVTMIQFFETGG